MIELTLHFDGACEPVNPGGIATYGWVLAVAGVSAATGHGVAAEGPGATNNLAEYYALGHGLRGVQEAVELWAKVGADPQRLFLTVSGDSQLVVKQVKGAYACRAANLIPLRDRCLSLVADLKTRLGGIEVVWVPREQNEAADALSRHAWQQYTGKPFPERR